MKPKKGLVSALIIVIMLLLCSCAIRTRIAPSAELPEPAHQEELPQEETLPEEEPEIPEKGPEEPAEEPQETEEPPEEEQKEPESPEEPDASEELPETPERPEGPETPQDDPDVPTPPQETQPASDEELPAPEDPAAQPGNGPVSMEKESLSQADLLQLVLGENGAAADPVLKAYQDILWTRVFPLLVLGNYHAFVETAYIEPAVYSLAPELGLTVYAGEYTGFEKWQDAASLPDDAWIARNDPDVIAILVGPEILGRDCFGTDAAKELYESLSGREGWNELAAVKRKKVILFSEELMMTERGQTAAVLGLTKMAFPGLMEDVDIEEAVDTLTETDGTAENKGCYLYFETEE